MSLLKIQRELERCSVDKITCCFGRDARFSSQNPGWMGLNNLSLQLQEINSAHTHPHRYVTPPHFLCYACTQSEFETWGSLNGNGLYRLVYLNA